MRPAALHPRRSDWPERLAALVEARRHVPFTWGAHDCAMFAADAVLAQTDRDFLARWRGAYATEDQGEAITGGAFGTFMAAALAAFGAAECPTGLAQRGDVALVRYGNTQSLGVVLGGSVAVPGLSRLSFLPAGTIERVWVV
jgi:hypothetical protein